MAAVTLRGYRREWLVLVLVALATLPILNVVNTQDVSRLALTNALARGSVRIDRDHRETFDRAYYKGHWYSDKAPGVSILALAPVQGLRVVDAVLRNREDVPIWERAMHVWLVRMWVGGVAFVTLCFLLGRVAEGLAAGTGAATAVTFGVGTMVGSLASTTFAHVPAAAALFLAFVLATRTSRDPPAPAARWAAIGLAAGAAALFEYQAAAGAAIIGTYVAWRGGRRALAAFVAGALPPFLVLGAYNWAAFDSPFRLSYSYVANDFTEKQREGFFGIGVPTLRGAWFVFLDGHGLLLVSPVLVLAAAGLVLFTRRHRAEGLAAAAIVTFFLVYTMGYFLPNGGTSPGPRFTTGGLPFLALGLPYAFARWRWPTIVLAAASIGVAMFDELTWAVANKLRVIFWPHTVWSRAGLPVRAGVLLLLLAATAAGLVALYELLRRPPRREESAGGHA